MYYLGVDIATDNPGYAILSGPRDVVFCKTCKTKKESRVSEILKCVYQKRVLSEVLKIKDYAVICVEAPALGFDNRMVSIGMIHGAIVPDIIATNKPVVYCPPTKWKYALLGNGRAEKKAGIDFVLSNFRFAKGLDLSHFDSNQADATILAYIGYLFDSFSSEQEPFIFDGIEKRVKEIFFSEKVSSIKKAGILHRPNEFYFNK